jgi:hypothetical protein
MQSGEEIAVAHWRMEIQKSYIRIAMLILSGNRSSNGYGIALFRRNFVCLEG